MNFVVGIIQWEPFLVFGRLQLRYERAFGILPEALLTGFSFAAYHIGTHPPARLVTLLIVWPLAWCVGSSIGTLRAARRS